MVMVQYHVLWQAFALAVLNLQILLPQGGLVKTSMNLTFHYIHQSAVATIHPVVRN